MPVAENLTAMTYTLSEPGTSIAEAFKNFTPVPASAPDMRLCPRAGLTSMHLEPGLTGAAGEVGGAGAEVVASGAGSVGLRSAVATSARGVGDEQLTSATVAAAASTAPILFLKTCSLVVLG
jgi:hypothetical protein